MRARSCWNGRARVGGASCCTSLIAATPAVCGWGLTPLRRALRGALAPPVSLTVGGQEQSQLEDCTGQKSLGQSRIVGCPSTPMDQWKSAGLPGAPSRASGPAAVVSGRSAQGKYPLVSADQRAGGERSRRLEGRDGL